MLWATILKTCGGSTASIEGLNGTSLWLGTGRQYSFKLSKHPFYSTFPNQPTALDPAQQQPTDQYIFDSGVTDAFNQPSTTPACTLPGKHPIIHAIQPDGSTVVSMGKKSIPPTNTNRAIQRAADGHIFQNLQDHSILSIGRFCYVGHTVTFRAKDALILLNGEVVLQ